MSRLAYFHINGVPRPASRPRVTRNGTFYSKPYAEWKKNALEQYPDKLEHMFDGPLFVRVTVSAGGLDIELQEFEVSKRPKGVRGDIDNYVKAAMDFLQESGAIANDKQVELLEAIMVLDE